MRNHRAPLWLLLAWGCLETLPTFASPFLGDDAYSSVYNYSEDVATIALTLALYTALSYTSTLLKAAAFFTVIVSFSFAAANIAIDVMGLQDATKIALIIALVVWLGAVATLRFIFRFDDGDKCIPMRGHIYLIVRKPHSFIDMLALVYSGLGGGFVAYHDGDVWRFDREEGCLIKAHDKSYYIGKRMIDCGEATEEKLVDLNRMRGTKWSIFNNCVTVFAGWRRKWLR